MPGRGINVQATMKWLLDYVYSGRLPLAPPPVPASADPDDFGGGTPNMKLLFAASRYAYAVLSAAPDLLIHRQRMANVLAREKACHGQGEPTSASHGQLWLAGMAGCLYVTAPYVNPGTGLEQAVVDWLAVQHAIHRVTESNGEMWCAGGRGLDVKKAGKPAIGSNPATAKMWQAIEGAPTLESLEKAGKPPAWGKIKGKPNQYDIGPWLLSLCPPRLRAAIRRWPDAFPPMAGELTAERWENGDFYSVYRNMDLGVLDVTLSAGVLNGERWVSKEIDEDRLAVYAGAGMGLPILWIATAAARPAGSDRPAKPPRPGGGRKAGW